MGRPTDEELADALQEAGRMREQGEDPHFVAKSLLNHNYRLNYLLQLYHQLEHYFHAGQAESEHTRLIKMLEKVRQEERHAGLDR